MRLYLDCTATLRSGLNTGIQRVVRNIVGQALEQPVPGIRCVPAVFRHGTFRRGKPTWRLSWLHRYRAALRNAYAWARAWSVPLRRVWPLRLPAYVAFVALRWLLLTPAEWLERFSGRKLALRQGDVLVLLDASWPAPPGWWDAVDAARTVRVRVIAVIYDLIPISHPATQPRGLVRHFENWLDEVLARADGVLCISEATRKAVLGEIGRRGLSGRISADRVAAFPLGHELDRSCHSTGLRPEVIGLGGRSRAARPYLAVGTFEPRKRHDLILDAFEILWRDFPEAEIWMVGTPGWLVDGLLRRLRRHRFHGSRLRIFHDLTDAELDFAYRHAKAILAASDAEGFGLPVVEALVRGCPVIASDIPPFREIASGYARFFPPGSAEALAAVLREVESDAGALANPAGFAWPGWPRTTIHFLREAERLAGAVPYRPMA